MLRCDDDDKSFAVLSLSLLKAHITIIIIMNFVCAQIRFIKFLWKLIDEIGIYIGSGGNILLNL